MGMEDGPGEGDGLHVELTREIIGAAMEVLKALKPGLDEKVYENALVVELRDRRLAVEQQRHYDVQYKEHLVGRLIPDLVVEEKVIVDPKVVDGFHAAHVAQMLGYLAISGLRVALLLNFKHERLQVKRVSR